MADIEIERDAQAERVIELMRGMGDVDRQKLTEYATKEVGLTFVPAVPVTNTIAD